MELADKENIVDSQSNNMPEISPKKRKEPDGSALTMSSYIVDIDTQIWQVRRSESTGLQLRATKLERMRSLNIYLQSSLDHAKTQWRTRRFPASRGQFVVAQGPFI